MLNLLAYRMANGKIANYDEQTSIHYGVISQHSVVSEIWENFESVYEIECPSCNMVSDQAECAICGADNESEFEFLDEPSYQEWNGEKEYSIEYAESLSAFYVTRSPYYTYAAFCSPCAPNAGDLDAPRENFEGIRAYCLDASFFENNNAPYPVYRVSDNQRVKKDATPK